MSIKYNERGEVVSVNGLTTGHHIGAPMQDAIAEKPEDNMAYGEELRTVTRYKGENDEMQPKPSAGGVSAEEVVSIVKEQFPGGVGGSGGWFVVTVSADESGNIIADHYRDDIAAAFEKGEMPVVKMTYEGETTIMNVVSITQYVANFGYVALAGNQNNADVLLQELRINKEDVSFSMRNIVGG